MQLFQKNSISHFQETVIDSEDSPESVDSESSSDKEVYNCIHVMIAHVVFSL